MTRRAALIAVALLVALPAHARAPEPLKPLDLDRFMGRWNEILRTPNGAQKDCFAAYQVWSRRGPDRFSIAQTCHKGSAAGPVRTVDTAARLLDPQATAKFEASFFGGLIRRQYWVLDRAEDYSWMIAATASGGHVALLSRRPSLTAAEKEAFRQRIAALGLDAARLVAVDDG